MPAGTVAVICVGPSTVKLAGTKPSVTEVAPVNSVPVRTTLEPVGDGEGAKEVIVGAGGGGGGAAAGEAAAEEEEVAAAEEVAAEAAAAAEEEEVAGCPCPCTGGGSASPRRDS